MMNTLCNVSVDAASSRPVLTCSRRGRSTGSSATTDAGHDSNGTGSLTPHPRPGGPNRRTTGAASRSVIYGSSGGSGMRKESFEIVLPIGVTLLGRLGLAIDREFPGATLSEKRTGYLTIEVDMDTPSSLDHDDD